MSIFNPEFRETPELNREAREFSKKTEAQLMKRIEDGHESFPDTIGCPNPSCQHPLKVSVGEVAVEILCNNCGFAKTYQKKD